MSVDITGVDKVELLRALWTATKPASFFNNMLIMAPNFCEEEASAATEAYIDYYSGRCIKTDISGNKANPFLYDREVGEGAFAKIVASLIP